MARKAGQGEEEEESRARQQGRREDVGDKCRPGEGQSVMCLNKANDKREEGEFHGKFLLSLSLILHNCNFAIVTNCN
ncbi:hypothetical protein STEG23_001760, partial [Scotinomys teguina]